jgi:pyridoxal phosphate enzyme (YggS family)
MGGATQEEAVLDAALPRNLARVREAVAAAAARSGRDPAAVRLVAVTKGCAPPVLRALAALGALDVGENRVQEADGKRGDLSHLPLRWHMIGRLQTNKVRRALDLFHRFHSVDRPALLEALGAAAASRGRIVDLLLQVKMIDEAGKGGFAIGEAEEALRLAGRFPALRVGGLMTLPPPAAAPEASRAAFRGLRELRDALRSRPGLPPLGPDLSMGTTQDFEVAVEEGATLVRVGSALYEGLPPSLFRRAPAAGAPAGTGG